MKGAKSASVASKKADDKLGVKRGRPAKAKPTKKEKPAKDPNRPKRPPSAFFCFMEEFRKEYKEKFPENKSIALVGKAGGEKWRKMTEAEKAPFVEKSEQKKQEHIQILLAYDKNKSDEAKTSKNVEVGNDSDKSKSEVNDEEGSEDSAEVGDDME